MTLEETMVICMLNTIQDKNMMVKVQEHMKENMDWEDVRNIIVKLDRAAHISIVISKSTKFMQTRHKQKHAELVARKDTWQHHVLSQRQNSSVSTVT